MFVRNKVSGSVYFWHYFVVVWVVHSPEQHGGLEEVGRSVSWRRSLAGVQLEGGVHLVSLQPCTAVHKPTWCTGNTK